MVTKKSLGSKPNARKTFKNGIALKEEEEELLLVHFNLNNIILFNVSNLVPEELNLVKVGRLSALAKSFGKTCFRG